MKLTIAQKIKRFVEKYPEPKQFRVELSYNGKVDKIGIGPNLNLKNIYSTKNKIKRLIIGENFFLYQTRYDTVLKLFEISITKINTDILQPNEKRRFKYVYRYFIPFNTKKIYNQEGEEITYLYKFFSKPLYLICEMRQSDFSNFVNRSNFYEYENTLSNFDNDFNKLIDGFLDLPEKYNSWTYKKDINGKTMFNPSILVEWVSHESFSKKIIGTPKQNKIEKIIKDTESSLYSFEKIQEIIDANKHNTLVENIRKSVFDTTANVLRTFLCVNNTLKEERRVYFLKGGKVLTCLNKKDRWFADNYIGSYYLQNKCSLVNYQDVVDSIPHFEFYKEYCSELFNDYKNCGFYGRSPFENVEILLTFYKEKQIELLWKMRMRNFVKEKLSRRCLKWRVEIKSLIKTDSKKIPKMFGLSLSQLRIIKKITETTNPTPSDKKIDYYNIEKSLSVIFSLYNTNDISSLDTTTFETLLTFSLNHSSTVYTIDSFKKGCGNKSVNIFKRIAKNENTTMYQLIVDSCRLLYCLSLQNRPNINIASFRNEADLIRVHDSLIELLQQQNEEKLRLRRFFNEERKKELEKQLKKVDEKRKFLEYENEDFIIRLPESTKEIVEEGSCLHHCVGGYSASHVNGRTTILFLRKKSDLNTPFYTIEINNNKEINQIHGMLNCWLGNAGVKTIKFVKQWTEEKNIVCDIKILTCLAKGYNSNNAKYLDVQFA